MDIDRDAAHDAAQNELSKAIYSGPSLTERFWDWLNGLVLRVAMEGANVPGGWLTLSVLAVIVVVALVVAVRIARRTMRTRRRTDHSLYAGQELSAAQHRATAEQCAAAGDWAAAIRHRLRAVARHLEETTVLDALPGRTATELARAASTVLPHLDGQFTWAADVFNDVSYGDHPGTESAYRTVADLDEHLRRNAPTAAGVDAAPPQSDRWAGVR